MRPTFVLHTKCWPESHILNAGATDVNASSTADELYTGPQIPPLEYALVAEAPGACIEHRCIEILCPLASQQAVLGLQKDKSACT